MPGESNGTDTRTRLLEATYRVLAERGFAGLTTQRVADEADCSQSLVHYHFSTKEDLVVALLERTRENEHEWLATLESGTAEERLRRFVDLQLSIPRGDEHGRFNVAFAELVAAAARNDRYADALREFADLVQTAVADVVRDGVESGEFADVDPEATARFLRYALDGAVRDSLTIGDDRAKAETRAATEAYIDRVLLAERE